MKHKGHEVHEENLHRDNAAEMVMRLVRDAIVWLLRVLRVLRA